MLCHLAAGFTKRVRAEGFRLYFKVVGFSVEASAAPTESESAFDAIEAWEQTGFVRIRAALQHKHPDVALYMFANNLVPVRGPAALGAMATLLDRWQSLESSPERKATRRQDKAALATLEERGLTKTVRHELMAKLKLATIDLEAPAPAVEPVSIAERRENQVALYLWLQDWTETARAVVTNRADLIRLGIAKRRPRAKAAQPVAPPAVTPTPAPAPAPVPPVATANEMEDHGPSSRAA